MKRNIVAISAVVVAILIVVPSLILFEFSSPNFTVKEGSSTHTMIGDLFGNNTFSDSFSSLNTTTTISEKGHTPYKISAIMAGQTYNLGQNNTFDFQLFLDVNGAIPGNMHSTGLIISVMPLRGSGPNFSSYINNFTTQNKENYLPVPFPPPSSRNVSSTSGDLKVYFPFINNLGQKQNKTFNFFVSDLINCGSLVIPSNCLLQYNTTYGVSVVLALTGLNKPIFNAFYIYFISVPEN